MNISKNDNIFIIGATSSLAQATTRALAKRGASLILCGRDENELELLASDIKTRYGATCRIVVSDISEPGFSAGQIIAEGGEFNYLLIAIGDMGNGSAEDLENMAHTTFINYAVPAQLASVAASRMARQKGGQIAIISSVAGDRGRASNYVYGSAKAALSAFASGLRNRYARQGVHIMTIKPGFVDTPMTWAMKSPLIASREYVAEKIVSAMEKNKDVIYVPWFWQIIMLIIMHIPEKIFKRLKL